MAKNHKPALGIDLGGTNMQIGVVSPDFKLLGSAKRKTKAAEGTSAVLDRIVEGALEAIANAKLSIRDIACLGLGAPGAVDPDQGVVLEAVNLRWKNTPAAELLAKKLGVPVFLDNDVNVAVYGENRLGAGKGSRHMLGVWVGTGIGGGLILNGELFYGHFMTAGEIGHMIALPNNPPGHRSLEHNCSRTAVVDQIVRLIKSNRKSRITELCNGDFDDIKSKMVAKAFEDGDEVTREVVLHAAELLGIEIAGVVTLLSLERVVLGGGLTEAIGKPFVDLVDKSVKNFAFPDRCKNVKIVASQLEDNAGVYGAAMIALERLERK
ncbi:MAG: ROK family protein [Phycisphaeraceae bacterium]|nr:MAG: ROK family protein [Phycisphaeraceae bacterium]